VSTDRGHAIKINKQKLVVSTKFNLSEQTAAPFISLLCPQIYVLVYIPIPYFPLHIPTINSNSGVHLENPVILSALFTTLDVCYFHITYLCAWLVAVIFCIDNVHVIYTKYHCY
jgi:hypothetical protein